VERFRRTHRTGRQRGAVGRGSRAVVSLLIVGGVGTMISQLELPVAWKVGSTAAAALTSVLVEVVREGRERRADIARVGVVADSARDDEAGPHALTGEPRPARVKTELFPLPPDIQELVGRETVLTEIRPALVPLRGGQTIVLLVGKAGVGKTALAVRAAYELASEFPDGQLYVNLRGVESQRLRPADVLAGFLRALGVEGAAIPQELDDRVELYRSRLAHRRILVVLDNAADDEGQVRPLLPEATNCAALVTSRFPLAGLDRAHRVALDVLDSREAVHLLAAIAGADRVTAEPDAAELIARLCGFLPLAVRIAGAKLAAKKHWTLQAYHRRLQNRLLDELRAGDHVVRASFALSYEDRSVEERKVFRMLGVLQAADFAAWPAAALLERELRTAEELVEELVDAQLLEGVGIDAVGQVRYRFHDLLRVYARERLDAEESVIARQEGLERVLGAYLTLAELADAQLKPDRRRTLEPGRAVRTALGAC
jgi:NB-ARC domain